MFLPHVKLVQTSPILVPQLVKLISSLGTLSRGDNKMVLFSLWNRIFSLSGLPHSECQFSSRINKIWSWIKCWRLPITSRNLLMLIFVGIEIRGFLKRNFGWILKFSSSWWSSDQQLRTTEVGCLISFRALQSSEGGRYVSWYVQKLLLRQRKENLSTLHLWWLWREWQQIQIRGRVYGNMP